MRQFEEHILRSAVYVFGPSRQEKKAIEEMSELIKELCKDLDGLDRKDGIAEEMADVGIMLDQLGIIFNNAAKVAEYRQNKLNRLQGKIFNEQYGEGGCTGQ